jgi:hypothetical protein
MKWVYVGTHRVPKEDVFEGRNSKALLKLNGLFHFQLSTDIRNGRVFAFRLMACSCSAGENIERNPLSFGCHFMRAGFVRIHQI